MGLNKKESVKKMISKAKQEAKMYEPKEERITIIIKPWLKQVVKEKCCVKRKTMTEVIITLLEKWAREK